jgi:hypothetical protein
MSDYFTKFQSLCGTSNDTGLGETHVKWLCHCDVIICYLFHSSMVYAFQLKNPSSIYHCMPFFPLRYSFMHKQWMFVTYLNQPLQLENGQGGAMVLPSNSSDRSDRSDKPMDQKVLISSPMSSVLFSVCYLFTMMVSR